jgi:type IV secretory pathway VirB6-like protein
MLLKDFQYEWNILGLWCAKRLLGAIHWEFFQNCFTIQLTGATNLPVPNTGPVRYIDTYKYYYCIGYISRSVLKFLFVCLACSWADAEELSLP